MWRDPRHSLAAIRQAAEIDPVGVHSWMLLAVLWLSASLSPENFTPLIFEDDSGGSAPHCSKNERFPGTPSDFYPGITDT